MAAIQQEGAVALNRPRFGFSLRRALIAVAIAASLCGVLRNGSGATAWALVVVCTTAIAAMWYRDALSVRRERDLTTGRIRRLGLSLTAVVLAALIVGLSNFAFLIAFDGVRDSWEGRSANRPTRPVAPEVIIAASAHGLLIALLTAFALRRAVWPRPGRVARREASLQRFGPLVALGLLALMYAGCRLAR